MLLWVGGTQVPLLCTHHVSTIYAASDLAGGIRVGAVLVLQ